jgi:hypothetical protein
MIDLEDIVLWPLSRGPRRKSCPQPPLCPLGARFRSQLAIRVRYYGERKRLMIMPERFILWIGGGLWSGCGRDRGALEKRRYDPETSSTKDFRFSNARPDSDPLSTVVDLAG